MSPSPSPLSSPGPSGRGPEAISPSSGGGFPLWAKLLLGCGVVALVLMIVGAVLVYWGIQRFTRPGRTLEAQQVVSERSVGWVRVEPIVDDPGMSELVKSLFLVLQRLGQRQQQEDMPEWMRGWYELGQAQQGYNPALDWFLPREMTLAFEPIDGTGDDGTGDEGTGVQGTGVQGTGVQGTEGEDPEGVEEAPSATTEMVAAFNLGFLARMIGWFSSMDEGEERLREVRGHEVHVGSDGVMAFLDGTLLRTADLEAMERLLDRIEAGGVEGAGSDVRSDPTLTTLGGGDWDLYGHLDNRRGDFEDSVTGFTEWLGSDPTPVAGTVEEAVFRIDVVTAETLEAELELEVTSEEAAAAWIQALDEHRAALETEVLRIELDRSATGRRVRAEWKLRGLDEWLARKMVRALEEGEGGTSASDEDRQVEEAPHERPRKGLPVERPPGTGGVD